MLFGYLLLFNYERAVRRQPVDDSVGDGAPFDAQVVQFFQFLARLEAFEDPFVPDFG